MPHVSDPDKPFRKTDILMSVIDHIFLPPKLPQGGDHPDRDKIVHLLLTELVFEYSVKHASTVPAEQRAVWDHMCLMLRHVGAAVDRGLERGQLARDLAGMVPGGEHTFCTAFRR